VFYALIDTVVDRYFPIVAQLELDLDEIEDNIFKQSSDMRKNIEDLYNLKIN
jgi:magnesium transporter